MRQPNAPPVCVCGVLVGGRSRRMGSPKALLQLPGGTSYVERAVEVASVVASEVVLLGQVAPLPDSVAQLPALPDVKRDGGPSAGLCALLEHAGSRWALLLACDMPHLDAALLRRLLDHAYDDIDAVAYVRAETPDTHHGCCALYHPRISPIALDELTRGRASLQRLLSRIRTTSVTPTDDESHRLTNVNTPADHHRATRRP